ncbi:NusB antitermination factor [Paenisporosarcina quisquiliarum]|jgi:transcription antitermination protein NusB|uniref:Transcription antitermination protein NusB n=1 Tax=Psychrobacillus psychrodurans TaxID=126157 RepID=A0A9X3RC28_9BACI|nr:transcription antitermination factor NusB [Psychrobacillus psychrodurans]SEM44512.1 NusB antitermination factor [Paenisporosarcina quisquiliarum]MCK1999694.1 transcription antitermination factor NusB [Psychrobacillus psychrodurans]MCZ8534842.1 transcription antitermination factor NusB [Psychrobacillus psychrodurans]MCZ8542386.1 transcription antitermination factor NusB [Psychrobacillus psychrodurans]SFN21381.1 N utilization substance protein B [Psychrobacillus psychrodurans]
MKRRQARELALQALFQLDNHEISIEEAIGHVTEEKDSFLTQVVSGVVNHKEEIDASLTDKLENWSLSRLPKIERTVLRIAVFELLYTEETPAKVVINEALEICKVFGDEKSSRFVNGVLSKYAE